MKRIQVQRADNALSELLLGYRTMNTADAERIRVAQHCLRALDNEQAAAKQQLNNIKERLRRLLQLVDEALKEDT